jgi:hypothetical protein
MQHPGHADQERHEQKQKGGRIRHAAASGCASSASSRRRWISLMRINSSMEYLKLYTYFLLTFL